MKGFLPTLRNLRTAEVKKALEKGVSLLTKQKMLELEPMARFGFGIVSYMQLLRFMSFVFAGLTIIQIPVMYTYSQGTAYKKPSDLFLGGYDFFMLGNLGYSAVNCDSIPVNVGHLGLQCNYGTVGKITDFGFHERNDEDTFEMCVNDDRMLACKPDHPDFVNQLTSAIGKDQFSF